MPHHIFKKSLAEVEKEKEDRRKAKTEEIKKEYEENPKKRFELTTEQRPTVSCRIKSAGSQGARRVDFTVPTAILRPQSEKGSRLRQSSVP